MALYIRTGSSGTGPDVVLNDLGITIATSASWTLLTSADGYGPEQAAGQFSSIELKESGDLYAQITATNLEWSLDGVSANAGVFDSDDPLVIDVQNNDWDFTYGRITLPNRGEPYASPRAGDIYYDSDDGYLAFYDGSQTMFVALSETGSVSDHGSLAGLLDDDHTQYPLLTGNAGRNAITGTFDFGDGYLIAPTYTSAPVTSVIDGAISVVTGVMYVQDGSRSKWLSVDRKMIWAGRDAVNATDIYLRTVDSIASSTTGYRLLRDGTITGLVAQTTGAESWTFEVRKNGVVTPIASLIISASSGAQSTITDVDVAQGDEIEFYCNGSNINRPIGGVEIAWRI